MKIVGMDSKNLIIPICEMIFTKADKESLPMVNKQLYLDLYYQRITVVIAVLISVFGWDYLINRKTRASV